MQANEWLPTWRMMMAPACLRTRPQGLLSCGGERRTRTSTGAIRPPGYQPFTAPRRTCGPRSTGRCTTVVRGGARTGSRRPKPMSVRPSGGSTRRRPGWRRRRTTCCSRSWTVSSSPLRALRPHTALARAGALAARLWTSRRVRSAEAVAMAPEASLEGLLEESPAGLLQTAERSAVSSEPLIREHLERAQRALSSRSGRRRAWPPRHPGRMSPSRPSTVPGRPYTERQPSGE